MESSSRRRWTLTGLGSLIVAIWRWRRGILDFVGLTGVPEDVTRWGFGIKAVIDFIANNVPIAIGLSLIAIGNWDGLKRAYMKLTPGAWHRTTAKKKDELGVRETALARRIENLRKRAESLSDELLAFAFTIHAERLPMLDNHELLLETFAQRGAEINNRYSRSYASRVLQLVRKLEKVGVTDKDLNRYIRASDKDEKEIRAIAERLLALAGRLEE